MGRFFVVVSIFIHIFKEFGAIFYVLFCFLQRPHLPRYTINTTTTIRIILICMWWVANIWWSKLKSEIYMDFFNYNGYFVYCGIVFLIFLLLICCLLRENENGNFWNLYQCDLYLCLIFLLLVVLLLLIELYRLILCLLKSVKTKQNKQREI